MPNLSENEPTLWYQQPAEQWVEVLPEVQWLIAAGEYAAAYSLCREMQGPYNQSYQPLGDLRITFHSESGEPPSPEDYHREIDLRTAIATTRYRRGTVTFTREAFASHPAQIIAVRLTADAPAVSST